MYFYMDVWVATKFLAARIIVTHAKIVEVHGMMHLENRDLRNELYIFHWNHVCEVCWAAKSMYNPYDTRTTEQNETRSICQVYYIYISIAF